MYTVILMAALAPSNSNPEWSEHNHPIFNPGPGLGYGYTGVGHTCRGWMKHGGVYDGAWASHYTGADPTPYGGYGGGNWGCIGTAGPHAAWPPGFPGGLGPNVCPIPPVGTRSLEVLPPPSPKTSARVRIDMPADAQLFVEGTLMKTTSAVRLFQTPALNPDQTYYYELKAVLTRNNQTYTDVQRIAVRPGEQATASFTGLEQRAAAVAGATPTTAKR
jgi:uncharacterized protein (TIGR03000 family)